MKISHNQYSDEQWESRELGASEEYVRRVSDEDSKSTDEGLGLQVISIRLHRELIDIFKELAIEEGIGYQPLMRQVLTRYARDAKRRNNKLKAIK